MKKISYLFLFFFISNALYGKHKVKFVITQKTTIQNDSIYISGSFNDWIDKPISKYLLTKIDSKQKTISLELKNGDYEFAFHRGAWDKAASDSIGIQLKNKKISINKDTIIQVIIQNWKDQLPFLPQLTITKELINNNVGIPLSELNIWYYTNGNEINWAKTKPKLNEWTNFRPFDIDAKQADNNNRREAWFVTNLKIDTSLLDVPINFKFGMYGAGEIYLNGKLIKSFGNSSKVKALFQTFSPSHHIPFQFTLDTNKVYVLAIHAVDYLVPIIKEKHNKSWEFRIWDQKSTDEYSKHVEEEPFFNTIWLSVGTVLCILFWALAFQNQKEKNIWLIALTSTSLLFYSICTWMPHNVYASKLIVWLSLDYLIWIADKIFHVLTILLFVNLFKRKITLALKILLSSILLSSIIDIFYPQVVFGSIYSLFLTFCINIYYIISSRKQLKGAQWFIVAGIMLSYIIIIAFGIINVSNSYTPNSTVVGLFLTSVFLTLPICLLLYIASRFKEFIKEVKYNSQQIIQLSDEKREQALNQQKLLEQEVASQTIEIRTSLLNLQNTQKQLIQAEKMASLGELTAGIAHEIQNPLNFVNNFSEVSNELMDEMNAEIEKGDLQEAKAISLDIKQNLEKINHHGKRADAIVKGMLQHSSRGNGKKELTDINKLADEYLRLAYHGLRAKDKSFNATFKTDFDESIGNINIIPQDIGRVILNLVTNAFYAVNEKKIIQQTSTNQVQDVQPDKSYEPIVSISTKKVGDKVEVMVADNGNGMPQKILDKIFQPFFTTKPTGQGTGLGLSLAYDLVKAHGGELIVITNENESFSTQETETIFTIKLPAT